MKNLDSKYVQYVGLIYVQYLLNKKKFCLENVKITQSVEIKKKKGWEPLSNWNICHFNF
jgi:hypothetical protein